uniref:Uncharacterized protein n=1 Tax=Euplotes crassus TaxID=5936 RepID=A0A7S3KMA8_EUPCR|mmetsp:Transcript_32070/g.31474  ORF Transcript_32070/g.31474 Transcript_32070/m.31474 type:complete len:224 (+) Transcript_32070:54-725(+)
MKECRKLVIEKLKEAKKTFEVIDQNYDSIVSDNAKQVNNAYINKAMTDSIKEAKRNLNFLENMHLMKKLDGQISEIEKDSTELKKYERQNDSFEQGDTKSFTQIMNNFVSDEDEHEVKIRTKIAPINKVSKRSRGKHSQRSNFKLPPSNKSFDKHVKLPKISSKVKFEECKTDQKEKDDINESSLFSEFTRDNLSYKNNQSTQYGKLEESMKKVNEYLDQSIG